ncbi:MAG: Phosphoglycerate mutase [Clostridia bacterium]|jgi:probable phosphoglycerate mutase|nr:Phosphoglycerate mutase [Clostridia bacterium]
MLRLYIVRHGQTEFNVEGRLQGRMDSPLTEKGLRDAEALGKYLSDISFDMVLASPSKRAQRTAEIICSGKDISIQVEPDMREINLGSWEGRTKEEVLRAYPQEGEIFYNKPHLYKPLEGDNYYDVQERAAAAVKRLADECQEGNILIVTHTVVVRAIVAYFMGYPMEKLWEQIIEGTSITLLEADHGEIKVAAVGETPHMK